ncbi:MAG TPA: phosphoglucosamine mutase [Rudaea sp.]|jgi:phosphoglucosamine mutase|nr:phosphoglucosamine mutase [Rudaea sp.]
MQKRYFGTDGIRGRAGEHPITAEFMLRLGRAVGRVLANGSVAPVFIGKDTRVSGYMLESALEAGLVSAGANVRLLGPMPTPAVAFLTRDLHGSGGIVISASHNPYWDNGVKFFDANGEKLGDAVELEIERELDVVPEPSTRIGKAARVDDAAQRYAAHCRAVAPNLDLRGLHIVLDCAHGATYQIAPRLFTELGAQVHAIGVSPDGENINRDCGATHIAALQAQVRDRGAAIGIAFDGDGDRLQMVDANGKLADGDDLLYILVRDARTQGTLHGPVVGTLMTNFGVERAIGELGAQFLRANVGDRHVLQMLKEHGGVLGGEASGHLLSLEHAPTGDGIVSALLVLDALQRQGKTLAQARASLRRVPQVMLNVRTNPAALSAVTVQTALRRVEDILRGRGRVVLRASGTEPLVRVTVEGEDAAEVQKLAQELANAVELVK